MEIPENVSKGQKVNSEQEGAKDRALGNTAVMRDSGEGCAEVEENRVQSKPESDAIKRSFVIFTRAVSVL